MVVAKFGSLPSAAASSFSVFSASGDESTRAAIAAITKAVLAIWVLFVPCRAVGVVGVPVSAGLFKGAFLFVSPITALTAFGVAASDSEVLLVALLSCTIPFFVVLASSSATADAISSARFAAVSARVAADSAVLLL